VIACGLPGTLSVSAIMALRFPVAAGLNVTWIAQVGAGRPPSPGMPDKYP
jgi:hypothetical protein